MPPQKKIHSTNQRKQAVSSVFEFEAIGTRWHIEIHNEKNKEEQKRLKKTIEKEIEEFERTYSRFKENSLISKMARELGTYTLPETAIPLLNTYEKLYTATDGLITPLIGSMMEDTGYDATYTLVPKKHIRDIPQLHEVMKIEGTTIQLKKPVLLDFGALGKGYCIDIISEIIEKNGIKNYTVDAGGDIRTRSQIEKPITIGLENPDNFSQIIATIQLHNQSICASSGSRRKWGAYHHIMNPKTKKSQEIIKATWVIADTTLLADGIATALFFVPPSKLAHIGKFQYVILTKTNELFYSPKLKITW